MFMNRNILLVFCICFATTTQAIDLYWVGDSTGISTGGIASNSRWHNPNCWSFTSGGTVHPLTYPGPTDDVYFDNNWLYNYAFVGDTLAECNNIYITDGAIVIGPWMSLTAKIHLYGNLQVTSINPLSESILLTEFHFMNAIGASLDIPNSLGSGTPYTTMGRIYIENGCELTVMNDYYTVGFEEIFISNGKLNLNGFKLKALLVNGNLNEQLIMTSSHLIATYIGNTIETISTSGGVLEALPGELILGLHTNSIINLDEVIINNQQMFFGTESFGCENCYIKKLTIDSTRINSFQVNGNIEKALITASEFVDGGALPYNMVIDTLIFITDGFPYPYLAGGHHFYFGCNTTITDSFLLINNTGSNIRFGSNDFGIPINVDLGNEFCFDSLSVIGLNNIGLPLHMGINSVDLGSNTNVLFDSCGYVNYLVWPGDANADSIVNALDMFSIGLYFGSSGPLRDSISNLWIGHNASDWSGTQYNGANYKQADCDGNGLIGFSDTIAINLNYGLTRSSQSDVVNRSGPPVYIVPDATAYAPGTLVTLEVWAGTISTPLNNVYGLNYQISIDPTAVEPASFTINYTGSWLGVKNIDMITMQRYNSGITNITQVRNNQSNTSGFGKIAEIKFIANNSISTFTNFPITVIAINAIDESAIPLLVMGVDTTIAVDPTLFLDNLKDEVKTIVYPNPTNGTVHIQSNKSLTNIEIIDISGKIVSNFININASKTTLDLSAFASGFYTLKISSSNGIIIEKLNLNK